MKNNKQQSRIRKFEEIYDDNNLTILLTSI